MSHTPHELAADFPEYAERIHDLKMLNPEFRNLMEHYHEINRQVHRAETLVEPISQQAETELRKVRAVMKDRLYQLLTGADAGQPT